MEQSVDVPVPQMMREIVEVTQPVLVERIKGRVADQMVEKLGASGHGRNRGSCAGGDEGTRIGEQFVEVPVPQVFKEIAEVVRLIPQARVRRIDEQIVQVPMVSSQC